MEKIIEYGMATGNDHFELLDSIAKGIKEGFQPYHGPFTTIQHNTLFIHQAMVKYEVKKKDQIEMGYSDFGLDETKKSVDEGEAGRSHCPWCQKEVTNGFSMCFSNFCICEECVEAAKDMKSRWKKDDGYGCFKCCRGKVKKEFDKLFFDKAGAISICQGCLDWASDILKNKEKYFKNMLQETLKDCTVEGMVVKLPAVQLDRTAYTEVKRSLELIGGKWKGGKTQGFVFEQDPTELLAQLANGEQRNLKKEHQFFATPDNVAHKMVDLLPWILEGEKILEPSAGDGALIKQLLNGASTNPTGLPITVDCFETMDLNRTKLKSVEGANIIGEDFLLCDLKDTYDIIIANPPFTKNQDIDHIRKMYDVCKPGGTIVTLASPSWMFGSQKKQTEFKAWLEKIGAHIEEIPEGEFKESGTSIRTMLIKIVKPAAAVIEEPVEAKTKSFLRKFNDYVFYDGGKYEETGLVQLLIYPDLKDEEAKEFVHAIYYDNKMSDELNKAIERAKEWVNGLKRCRVCGCTEYNCIQCIEKTESACYWVEPDLCSACEKKNELPSPQQILKEMKATNNEINKGFDELEKMLSPQNDNDMNFFQQLSAKGNVDMTIRIMEKNGKLTINLLPGVASAGIPPMNFKGTAAELDDEFFSKILPGFNEVMGIVSNIEAVKKEVATQPAAKEKTKTATKKANATEKKTPVKKDKTKIKVEEPAEPGLF